MQPQYIPCSESTYEKCKNPSCGETVLARFQNGMVLPVRTSVIFTLDSTFGVVWCFRCKFASYLELVPQQFLPNVSFVPFPQLEGLSLTADEILNMMEVRWREIAKSKKKGRPELAVGLRFDVFQRDGFRCQYCGLSAKDGALLHADHVIPESKGGPTTLENLITACVDCNLGKRAKDLSPEIVARLTNQGDCGTIATTRE